MLSKLDAALYYASIGWPIFPCEADGKRPVQDGWQHRNASTTDPDLIRKIWGEQPDFNIGFVPDFAGLLVLDIDVKHAADTLERWNTIKYDKAVADTLIAVTPSGGRHEYYRGKVRSTVGALIPGLDVDTRGYGGYVLLPPSTVDGKPYSWANGAIAPNQYLIADSPLWVNERLNVNRQVAVTGELDKPINVHRATLRLKQRVEKGEIAKSGSRANDETYRCFAELNSFDISPQVSFDLVQEHWNPFCVDENGEPYPWDEEELLTFAKNAAKYSTGKGIYTKNVKEEFTQFAEQAAAQQRQVDEAKRRERAENGAFENWDQQSRTPAPSWIVPGFLLERSTNILYGGMGSFKSTLAVDIGLSIACGLNCFGQSPRPGGVAYLAWEDGYQLKTNKREAWGLAHAAIPDAGDYLVNARPPLITDVDAWPAIIDELREKSPNLRLIILDTCSKAIGRLDAYDMADVNQYHTFTQGLVDVFGCAVLGIAHAGKDETRGIVGSAAWGQGCDGVFYAQRQEKTNFATVRCQKLRGAPERQVPWAFRIQSVGPGPVAFPIGIEAIPSSLERDAKLDAAAVGEALKKLGKPVTSNVLAKELVIAADPEVSPEALLFEAGRIETKLRKQAKHSLRCYCDLMGGSYMWRLPADCTD